MREQEDVQLKFRFFFSSPLSCGKSGTNNHVNTADGCERNVKGFRQQLFPHGNRRTLTIKISAIQLSLIIISIIVSQNKILCKIRSRWAEQYNKETRAVVQNQIVETT